MFRKIVRKHLSLLRLDGKRGHHPNPCPGEKRGLSDGHRRKVPAEILDALMAELRSEPGSLLQEL